MGGNWIIGGIGSEGASGVIGEDYSQELFYGDFAIDGHIGALPTPGPTEGPVAANEAIIQKAVVAQVVKAKQAAKAKPIWEDWKFEVPTSDWFGKMTPKQKTVLVGAGAVGIGILLGMYFKKNKK